MILLIEFARRSAECSKVGKPISGVFRFVLRRGTLGNQTSQWPWSNSRASLLGFLCGFPP